jgi:hypothetical protein
MLSEVKHEIGTMGAVSSGVTPNGTQLYRDGGPFISECHARVACGTKAPLP